MRRRGKAPSALAFGLGAGTVEVAAAFLPWVRTGSRERTSFELIGVARRFNVLQGSAEHAAAAAWYFVPLVVALALLAVVLHRPRWAGGLLVAAGTAGFAVSIAVASAPLAPLAGLRLAMVASVVTAGVGVVACLRTGTPRPVTER